MAIKKKTVEIEIVGNDKKFRATMAGVGGIAKKAAQAAAIAFGVVTAATVKAVNSFRDFEKQFTSVVTLLDDTSFKTKTLAQGINDLEKGILKLRRTSGESFDNLNRGLFDLISAGVDAEKAIAALEVATNLAKAGATTTSIAVDGLTSALNAYGFDASEAQTVSEKFFTAQKFGKTTIDELARGFGQVGSTASAFGISLNEVLGAVSAVTLAGVRTSEAYTGLKAVFSNIAKPTADAAKEAKRLGIAFDSIALRRLGLEGFFESITGSANFNSRSLQKLFGSVEALNIAYALTGKQAESFANITAAVGDKAQTSANFTNALERANATLDNRLKRVSGAANTLFVQLGQKLVPTIVKLSDKFLRFAEQDGGKFVETIASAVDVTVNLANIGINGLIVGVNTLRTALGLLLKPLDLVLQGFSSLTGIGVEFSKGLTEFTEAQRTEGAQGVVSGLRGIGGGVADLVGAGTGQATFGTQAAASIESGDEKVAEISGVPMPTDAMGNINTNVPLSDEQQSAADERMEEQAEKDRQRKEDALKREVEHLQNLRNENRNSIEYLLSSWTGFFDTKNEKDAEAKKEALVMEREFASNVGQVMEFLAQKNKKLALAFAVIKTAGGVARALQDYPFPASVAVGASVAAAGAVQIAKIQGAAQGGIVGGFDTGRDNQMMAVRSGEMIVPPDMVQALTPTLRDLVRNEDTRGVQDTGSQSIKVEFVGDAGRVLRAIERENQQAGFIV